MIAPSVFVSRYQFRLDRAVSDLSNEDSPPASGPLKFRVYESFKVLDPPSALQQPAVQDKAGGAANPRRLPLLQITLHCRTTFFRRHALGELVGVQAELCGVTLERRPGQVG